MTPITFQVKDAQGNLHNYSTVPLNAATDGLQILEGLVSLGVVPMVEAGISVMAKLAGSGQSLQDAMNSIEIDLDVEAIQAQFQAGFLRKNLPLLFKNTFRDGQRLSENNNLNCYAGNYGEMLLAAKEVEKANGFLSVLDIFRDGESGS